VPSCARFCPNFLIIRTCKETVSKSFIIRTSKALCKCGKQRTYSRDPALVSLLESTLIRPFGCVANTGLITPLESALTKTGGVGVLWLTRHATKHVYPERPSGARDLFLILMRMFLLSQRSESTGLSRFYREGSGPVGKNLSSSGEGAACASRMGLQDASFTRWRVLSANPCPCGTTAVRASACAGAAYAS
jgi:hypothetical protein